MRKVTIRSWIVRAELVLFELVEANRCTTMTWTALSRLHVDIFARSSFCRNLSEVGHPWLRYTALLSYRSEFKLNKPSTMWSRKGTYQGTGWKRKRGSVRLRKPDVRGCGIDWLCIPSSEVFDPRRSSFRKLRIRAWHAIGLELIPVLLAVSDSNP